MKLATAIEGGIAGATALNLLERTLHKIDTKPANGKLKIISKPGILKRLKKAQKKGSIKEYIELAGAVISAVGYFGITGLSKKKNAILRGALLGAMAGLGVTFLKDKDDKKNGGKSNDIITILLYTLGGLIAGAAIKRFNKKGKKK